MSGVRSQVFIQPYKIAAAEVAPDHVPTVSPPIASVTGVLSFEVVDHGEEDFPEPWVVELYNSDYLEVLHVSVHSSVK